MSGSTGMDGGWLGQRTTARTNIGSDLPHDRHPWLPGSLYFWLNFLFFESEFSGYRSCRTDRTDGHQYLGLQSPWLGSSFDVNPSRGLWGRYKNVLPWNMMNGCPSKRTLGRTAKTCPAGPACKVPSVDRINRGCSYSMDGCSFERTWRRTEKYPLLLKTESSNLVDW
jgi:hypothetical protein